MREWIAAAIMRLSNLHRRLLVVLFAVLGPRFAYAFTAFFAKAIYRTLDPLRLRSEAQARAALGGTRYADRIARIAEEAFVHRMWNLADLLLADRFLHRGTFARYGGTVPEPFLGRLLNAQQRGQAAILLTAYYGSFDLLPVFVGFNGVRSSAVYLPHRNPGFDAFRCRIRGRSGVEMIRLTEAPHRVGEVLDAGGTVALVADHHSDRKGLPVTFLGLPTRAIRSVGLLAWRHKADVVVAGIRRVDSRFRFEIIVRDVILSEEWAGESDPVVYITHRYLRALEEMILEDPTQYLWAYPRWGKELGERLEAKYRRGDQLSPSEA